ncbi:hypothetical protein Taro_053096 [Colocasia esculenta]|uniref:Uncharacterized protein n=1 Tax=Colocasia esculenta TaxID=4460 RepID=A0A843XLS9_COLES|nr:hypothetical protein [Colocasia esculenta]
MEEKDLLHSMVSGRVADGVGINAAAEGQTERWNPSNCDPGGFIRFRLHPSSTSSGRASFVPILYRNELYKFPVVPAFERY